MTKKPVTKRRATKKVTTTKATKKPTTRRATKKVTQTKRASKAAATTTPVTKVAPTQPDFKVVNTLMNINKKINDLYERKAKISNQIITKFGANKFTYELPETTPEGKKFVTVKVVDNAENLKKGETVFKSTSVNPVDISTSFSVKAPK